MTREQPKDSQKKVSNLGRRIEKSGKFASRRGTAVSVQMSVDQFLDELENVRDSFEWSFERDTRAGSERRAWPRFWILATAKNGPAEGVKLNPIDAVCYGLTGKFPGQKHWEGAAQTIGLSRTDAADLIAAATDRTWRDRDGRRRPDEYLQSLRVRLLESIGRNGGRIKLD